MSHSCHPARAALLAALLAVGAFVCRSDPAAAASTPVEVRVEGIGGQLQRNVLSVLSLRRAAREQKLNAAQVQNLHQRAPAEIETGLHPFGYYRPAIQAELKEDGGRWLARYLVDAGPQLLLDSVDVAVTGEGADDESFQRLMREFPLRRGSPVLHPPYERAKRDLADAAAEGGYLDGRFLENEIRVDRHAYRAVLVLHYDTGPRYRFGPVSFDQDILDRDLLQGYVPFRQGDVFDYNKLMELQDGLTESPYFSRVEVEPRRDLAQGEEVPVHVALTPNKPQRYTAGAGYGTDNGAHGRVGWEFRRLNRSGHRALGELTVSQIEKSVAGQYLVPRARPRTDVMTLLASYEDEHTKTSRNKGMRLGSSLAQERFGWLETLSLMFRRETFTVGADHGTASFLTPEASWIRTWGNDRIYPRRGWRALIQTRGAAKPLLSKASFGQVKIEGKLIHGFGRGFRAIARGDFGHTVSNEFRVLPPTLRFFAGGARSVRGFEYNELSPRDSTGRMTGGRSLVVGSLELESMFLGRWGAAVFYDAGNALLRIQDPLEHSAGIGLRWLSPVGLLRLDVARSLRDRGAPVRVHIVVGPDL